MPQKISTGMKEILTAPAYSTVKSGMMNLYVEDHHVKTHTAVKCGRPPAAVSEKTDEKLINST